MGTDRKGPLAAFVVIAIVAAILLVTSVRSQAQPQWFDHEQVPVTVVAAPPIDDPLRWAPATTLGQVVEDGVVLTQKPTSDPTSAPVPATLVAATTYDASVSTTTASVIRGTHTATVTHHHAVHHAVHVAHHRSHHEAHHLAHNLASPSTAVQTTQTASSSSPAQHGRHLGRSHASATSAGHAHGRHLGWPHH